jgi:DNA invertase Pin-like site-specific DNA recombinase
MKFIGYVRVSTKKQVSNGLDGIETQKNIIKNYVKNIYNIDNINFVEEIGSSYNNKHKLVKLLDCIKKDNYILLSDISRFGRNPDQLHKYLNLATKRKCKIHSILENLTFGNNKVEDNDFLIKTLQSAQFSNILSEKMKNSILRRKENGEHFGRAPFGYKKINKKLIKDVSQQKTIKRINDLVIMRYKYPEIAKILNNEKANSKKWTSKFVKNIIANNTKITQKYVITDVVEEEKTNTQIKTTQNNNEAIAEDFDELDNLNKQMISDLSLNVLEKEIQKIVKDFNRKRILNKEWKDQTIMEMIENTKLPQYFK